MLSEQPISVTFPVALSIVSLIHLPNFILPYWACVIRMTCCCVQLAWKVSQLQYSLLKPTEKHVAGCYGWILWNPENSPYESLIMHGEAQLTSRPKKLTFKQTSLQKGTSWFSTYSIHVFDLLYNIFRASNLGHFPSIWIHCLSDASSKFHPPINSMCHEQHMPPAAVGLKCFPVAIFPGKTWIEIFVHDSSKTSCFL